jgi:hypothetical protein
MQTRLSRTTFVLAALIAAVGWAAPAKAACADIGNLLPRRGGRDGLHVRQAPPNARLIADQNVIVGLWQFTFASDGNDVAPFFIHDGDPLDEGYAEWHSDGTEIMNSSRDPATSNFRLGVYESTAVRSFHLNHFALSWDNSGRLCVPEPGKPSCFVGRTNIREDVTVDKPGDTYSGTVTIDQYDQTGQFMFRLRGNVSARRITAFP